MIKSSVESSKLSTPITTPKRLFQEYSWEESENREGSRIYSNGPTKLKKSYENPASKSLKNLLEEIDQNIKDSNRTETIPVTSQYEELYGSENVDPYITASREFNNMEEDYNVRVQELIRQNEEYLNKINEEVNRHESEKVKFMQRNWNEIVSSLKKQINGNLDFNEIQELRNENRLLKEKFVQYQCEQAMVINQLKNEVLKLYKMIEEKTYKY